MAKTERVNLRLTPEMKEKLQKAADAENRTLTNYIENIMVHFGRIGFDLFNMMNDTVIGLSLFFP